jgi:metal-sulfur cluster biosynthetic enzyme
VKLREKIIQRLKEVIDPETGNVSLEFQPSSSVCPLALPLALDIENALKALSEIRDLSVTIRDHQMADELNRYLKEERE